YPGNAMVYGVGGSTPLGSVHVKEFEVAGVSARNFSLGVAGGLKREEGEGLLGSGFLLQADMEFDLPNNKVRFFRPKDCVGDQVVYWGSAYSVLPISRQLSDRKIDVRVLVNGKPIWPN